jgi:aldose 1-epimerase
VSAVLILSTANSQLELAPALGSALLRWRVNVDGRSYDILRPTDPGDLAAGHIERCASWPLVPWSNRIAQGRFNWDGQQYQLPTSSADPHAIHGIGWKRAWSVAGHERASPHEGTSPQQRDSPDSARAELTLTHTADACWPFSFHATQDIALSHSAGGTTLSLTLTLTNTGQRSMPAGLGAHPYFACEPDAELSFHAEHAVEHDEERLPIRSANPGRTTPELKGLRAGQSAGLPAELDFTKPRRFLHQPFDRAFTGWSGPVQLLRPSAGLALEVRAGEAEVIGCSRLVLYVPPEEIHPARSIAIEPVSHDTHAIGESDPGAHGLLTLAPGQSNRLSTTWTVRSTQYPALSGRCRIM